MKRIALVCAAVLLLGAAVFAIVRLPGRGAARAERAAAQPVAQAAPAAETPERADKPVPAGNGAARGKEAAAPRNESGAAPEKTPAPGEQPLRLPPDVDVEPIVEVIARMAAAGPASRSQARELSLVLAKYGVALPSVLSDLVAAEEEQATQATAEEIEQLRGPNQRLANTIRTRLVNLPLTTPDELEAFYVELLASMASTSASKTARMMAAGVLVEFASPPRDTRREPCRWGGNVQTAQRAVAAALEYTFNTKQGDFDRDLMEALLGCLYTGVPSGYLMLSVLAEPDRKTKAVDPLLLPLIAEVESLTEGEVPPRSRKALDRVLEDLRSHLGQPGSVYTAKVDRWHDIEAFFQRKADAINNEDKKALTDIMPPEMADTIAGRKSLRDGYSRLPNTERVAIVMVGGLFQYSPDVWRVWVQETAYAKGDVPQRTNTRVAECYIRLGPHGYRQFQPF